MNKRIFLAMAFLLPFLASAMKIERDEIDEFSGNRTIITSWESCSKMDIYIRFRFQENQQLLDFKFKSRDAIVIGKDDKLMFKSTVDEIGTFYSISIYHGGLGDGAVNLNGSGVWGIQATYKGDFDYFSSNITRLIRIYSTSGYYDKKVTEEEGKKFVKLYQLFQQALSNEPGTITFSNYTLKFLKKKTKSKEWDLVKEEYKKDLSQDELNTIVDNWKSQTTENTIYDVQIRKEK